MRLINRGCRPKARQSANERAACVHGIGNFAFMHFQLLPRNFIMTDTTTHPACEHHHLAAARHVAAAYHHMQAIDQHNDCHNDAANTHAATAQTESAAAHEHSATACAMSKK
jgi:hypothetical protein